jgi:serine/threonine protein kinase
MQIEVIRFENDMIGIQVKDYRIIQEIGIGGMASVFLVEHTMLHNQAALKLLNQEYVRNEHIRKRFLAEARSMARMSHTGVVKVTDLIEENDTVAFVMEYIDGETLKEYLDRKGKLKDDEIKTIFSQMLDSVGYVHEQNLVHRDIKPSNFMIDKKGKVKLMDFGIAKNTDVNSAEYTQTGTGMQMGTPMYMSPEQITETKSVTAQSDIYSLGVVLWQMVTGQKPYDTKTLSNFQLQMKIVQEPLFGTNTKWDVIIQKATAKSSELRYLTDADFKSGLLGVEKGKLASGGDKSEKLSRNNESNYTDDLTVVNSPLKNDLPSTKRKETIVEKSNSNSAQTEIKRRMFSAPFSFKGRIRRTEYGLSMIIAVFVNILTLGFGVLLTLPFMLAQGAKRCHDLNKSGWFQLIPFYNILLLFIEGDNGTNRFGDSPK